MNVINYDLKLDDEGDLFINDEGDFESIDSNFELVDSLFLSTTGEYKQNPLMYLNIYQYLQGSDTRLELIQKTKTLMEADGNKSDDLRIVNQFEKLEYFTNAIRFR